MHRYEISLRTSRLYARSSALTVSFPPLKLLAEIARVWQEFEPMNTVVMTAAAAAAAATAAATATAAVKSVLDKPLYELTEDDISQLTREDCRRYLKEKGMRRPSWNKSQAIQQVISLKSLLEPTPSRPSPVAARPLEIPAATSTTVTSSSSSSIKEFSAADIDGSVVALAEDRSLNQLVGPSGSDPVRDGESPGESLCAAVDSKPLPVRTANVPDLPIGQMTIFYSGKVNVYDGVPVDKQAHAIMHLASSPIQFCQDEPNSGNSTHWTTPRQLVASTVKFNVAAPDAAIVSMLSDVDGQTNRQVSLQRYFEKRKDRGKFRLKRKIESSSGLEMYLDHQMRMPVANFQPTQSNSSSVDQHEVFNTGYGFVDKQPKNPGLSVDLNNQGGQQHLGVVAFLLAIERCYGEVNNDNLLSAAVILLKLCSQHYFDPWHSPLALGK